MPKNDPYSTSVNLVSLFFNDHVFSHVDLHTSKKELTKKEFDTVLLFVGNFQSTRSILTNETLLTKSSKSCGGAALIQCL